MKPKLTQRLLVLGSFLAAAFLAARTQAENRGPAKEVLSGPAGTAVAFLQESKPKPAAKKKAPAGGRLPNNYGRIGLSEKQRNDIYSIQAKYRDQIEALEKQLADLRAKRDAEIEAVLTPEQKQKLEELKAAPSTEKPAAEPNKPAE